MKQIFTFLIGMALFVISVPNLVAQKQGVTIKETIVLPPNKEESIYVPFSESSLPIEVISNHLKAGSWQLLRRYFKDPSDYEKLINEFSFKENETTKGRFTMNTNTQSKAPLLGRLKPYRVKEVVGNLVRLFNLRDSSLASINFSFATSDNSYAGFYIKSAIVSFNSISKKQTASVASLNNKAVSTLASVSSNLQYVLLPDSTNKVPAYYMDFQDYFSGVKSNAEDGASVHYKQIDFEKLKIKFKWCKKVGPIKVCGKEQINYEFGKVISAKDVPGNENGMNNVYFVSPVDMTCFCNPFAASYTQFPGMILTAVIVDSRLAKITFLREGLEPIKYGGEEGEVSFDRPIAASFIGGFLYVLDKGNFVKPPNIKVLKINHTANGDFSITDVGIISTFGGNAIEGPNDLGGYTGASSNTLLVADDNGLNALDINPQTGLLLETLPRLYRSALNPQTDEKYPHFINIRRLDASTSAGTTVVITNNGDVISFSNTQTSSANLSNTITIDYLTSLTNGCNPSNLAYMEAEEKWYITDFVGKVHTLTKEGRYIAGGGKTGTSDGNEELSFPFGITPNCITDPDNNYRYRYIIGNEWGYDTGFKLFAPEFQISRFKVFENLSNGTLSFAFTTSGRWQHTEKATGISFHAMVINGNGINASLWNTQIKPGTPSSPGNALTGAPNTISINPGSIPNLKRGWNQVEIIAKIFIGPGTEAIFKSKKVNFYWLPSTFTPAGSLSNGGFKLNQYPQLGGNSRDYIYKPITMGNNAGFYNTGTNIVVSELGGLQFGTGSTFYNSNSGGTPLDNIDFQGDSKFTIGTGAFICINNTGPKSKNSEAQDKLVLEQGYKLGTNPPTLPEYANASCNSPCNFIDPLSPNVDFTANVSLISGPAFDVNVDPTGTTYADRVKWEIAKITNGVSSNQSSQVFEGKASDINLRTALNYNFQPCSQYLITLSIGCNDVGFVKIISKTINTSPVVTVSGGDDSEIICSSQTTAKFTGSPIGGVWTSSQGTITQDGVFNISSVPVSTDIFLTYTFTDVGGCSIPATKTIRILPPLSKPIANVTNPVCEGASMTMSTSGVDGALYNWILPAGDTMIVAHASEIYDNTSSADQGTYKLFITKNGCNSLVSDPIQVVVKPKPIIEAGDTLFVACPNVAAFTITGQMPTGGTWSGNGVTAQGLFTPSLVGFGYQNLTYTVTSSDGCINTDTKTIAIGPIVEAGKDDTVCVNSADYLLTGFSPPGGIWSGGPVNNAGMFSPSRARSTTTLTYFYKNPATGCANYDTKTIVIKMLPSFNPTASNNGPKCYNESVQLSVSTVPGCTYRWTGPNGFVSNEQNPTISFKDGGMPGRYDVVAISNGGCEGGPQNTFVSKYPTPDVFAGADTTVCSGSPSYLLKGLPSGGVWSGIGVTGNTFNPALTSGGEVILTYSYTSPNGCSFNDTKRINVNPPPTVSVLSNKSLDDCAYDLTDFLLIADIKEEGTFSYQWYLNDLIIAGATSQTYAPTQPGKYCVTVSGCGNSSACFALENVPSTKLKTSDCNIALATIFQSLACDAVAGATAYEYKVIDPLSSTEIGRITKPSTSPSFSLSELDDIKYNKTYQIFVRVLKGDNSTCSIFGNGCNVTTSQLPTTELRTEDCNIALANPTQTISANPIPGATFYEYRIKEYGNATEIARVLRSSDLRDLDIYNLPEIQKGSSYDVDIRALISVNNLWSTFGNACKVTVPCFVSMTPGNFTICSGSNTNIPLQSNPSGASFTWTASLVSGTVTGFSNGSGNSISQTLSGNGSVSYQVTPTLGCAGPTTSYIVNVFTTPFLTSFDKVICSGQNTNIALVSNLPSVVSYTWTTSLVSGNVAGFSNGNGNNILQVLSGSGIVKYKVTPTNGICIGLTRDFNVTVNTLPVISPLTKTICSTQSTNIVLSSTPSGTTFTWTASLISGSVSGYSNGSGGTISQTLNGSGLVRYQVIPNYNGCSGSVTNYDVNIITSPIPAISSYSDDICSGGMALFGIELIDYIEGVTFNWTTSVVSGNVVGHFNGSGDLVDQVLTGDGIAKYSVTPYYNGCYGKTEDILISVHTQPGLIINFNNPVDFPATINLTGLFTDLNNTIGTVTYWKNEAATIPVINPTAISESGLYFIKKVTNFGCVGMKSVYLTINDNRAFLKLDGGSTHVMVIKRDGSLWGWGENRDMQLGDGTDINRLSPVRVGLETWKDVACGIYNTIAIRSDGSLWGWGYNGTSSLGLGFVTGTYSTPVLISSAKWKTVDASFISTFAIKEDGTLWSCGSNDYGQLGIGNNTWAYYFTQIGTENNWEDVSAGTMHTIAKKTNGSIWIWGDNLYGQLGNGANEPSYTPQKIGLNEWKMVKAGYTHTLAIKNDGTLWGWGKNSQMELGDGTTVNRNIPTKIGNATDWKYLDSYTNGGKGIKNNNDLWGWGPNGNGELGIGNTNSQNSPIYLGVKVENFCDLAWASIIAKDGLICGAGDNRWGQLGDGTTYNRISYNCIPPFFAKSTASFARFSNGEIENPQVNKLENIPNPCIETTQINYSIGNKFSSAKVNIIDMRSGNILQEFSISSKTGIINVNLAGIMPGLYLYNLIVDGKKALSKKMIILK